MRKIGAVPVRYGSNLLADVRELAGRVDATFDDDEKGEVAIADFHQYFAGADVSLATLHAQPLDLRRRQLRGKPPIFSDRRR